MLAGIIGKSPISKLSAIFPNQTTLVVYENSKLPHGETSKTICHKSLKQSKKATCAAANVLFVHIGNGFNGFLRVNI